MHEDRQPSFSNAWELIDSGKKRAGFEMMLKVAQTGDDSAQQVVGYLYDKGIGTRKSRAKAKFWYRIAARGGSAAAASNLGIMFKKESRRRALYWFNKAVRMGLEDTILDIVQFRRPSKRSDREARIQLQRMLRSKDLAPITREQAEALLAGELAERPTAPQRRLRAPPGRR